MVAILLAAFNGEKYISEALESILKQKYEDLKVFVHDDGSTDQTTEIIRSFQEKYPQKIEIIDSPGLCSSKKNFLYLLRTVEAELYMFADQDDVWNKDKVALMVDEYNRLKCQSIPLLIFSDMTVVDSNLDTVSDSFMKYCRLDPNNLNLNRIIVQNVVPGCACLFNLKLRNEAIKYQDENHIILHDWWLACVATASGKIVYYEKSTMKYRQHGKNVVGASKDDTVYAIKKLTGLVSGKNKTKPGERTKKAVRQATELQNVFIADENNQRMISDLLLYEQSNKIERIKIFSRNHITRNKRNLWMYLFI